MTLLTILSFLKEAKDFLNNKIVLWGLVIGLIVLLLLLWKSNRGMRAMNDLISKSAERHIKNAENELTIRLDEADMRMHLKTDIIDSLLGELNTKPKHVIEYKYIYSDRTIRDTIVEHELIELGDFKTTFEFNEPCFNATVDLRGLNPTIEAKISTEIYDFYYYKRRPLWNIEKAPRWGKKELHQTLILPCRGDTVRENYKITTQ